MSNDMSNEECKFNYRMKVINKALEDGWTVRKSTTNSKAFELTKHFSKENSGYPNLFIFNSQTSLDENINNHLVLLREIRDNKLNRLKKSVSNPI